MTSNEAKTIILVPQKPDKVALRTSSETVLYMPIASTKTPGIVRIGKGLKVDAEGLLSLDEIESSDIKIAINGDVVTPDENRIVNIDLSEYATEQMLSDVMATVTDLTPLVMRSLKIPISAPADTRIVAIDDTNSQVLLRIGEGLTLENGTLKSFGGGTGGGTIVIENGIALETWNADKKADKTYVDTSIANSITNVLNTEV